MKLSQAKLKKMIREEVSRQVEEETLSEAGFIGKLKDTFKGVFGKEEPEKQEPEKVAERVIGSFNEFAEMCDARMAMYQDEINKAVKDFETQLKFGGEASIKLTFARVAPNSKTVFAVGFDEKLKEIFQAAMNKAFELEDKGSMAEARKIGDELVKIWNLCVEKMNQTTEELNLREPVKSLTVTVAEPKVLNKEQPSKTISDMIGSDGGKPLVTMTLGDQKFESANLEGQIIAERWQRLAGLIK